MIEWTVWGLLLAYAVPMILSPGPGNTVLAALGARFGVRGTFRFWMGFELGNFVWCLVYGFGLSELVKTSPAIYAVLKWGGTLYVLYLAWGFFRSASMPAKMDQAPMGFADGFMLLSLNPKIHTMILVMYSQFLASDLPLFAQVVQIALVFVAVGLICHFVWIYGGQILFSRFQSPRAIRAQGIAFGLSMVVVAAYTAAS